MILILAFFCSSGLPGGRWDEAGGERGSGCLRGRSDEGVRLHEFIPACEGQEAGDRHHVVEELRPVTDL